MSSTTLNGDHRGGEPWQIAERDRLSGVALEGHALTFLVGMPGSGRTTVLRQMQAKLETVGEAHVWCSSRSELQRVLDGLADGKRSGRLAVIVDDVIVAQDDQLWDRIRRLVMPADGDAAPDRGSAPRFLIASLSMPDWASVHGASGVVLRP